MVLVPKIDSYDIKVLIILGNQTVDDCSYNSIKNAIVQKLLVLDEPMFVLINKFINSDRILREAYAEVIMMRLVDNKYYIDDNVMNELFSVISIDTLMYYGGQSKLDEFSSKCKEEFYIRGMQIEDENEFYRKKHPYMTRLRSVLKFRKER